MTKQQLVNDVATAAQAVIDIERRLMDSEKQLKDLQRRFDGHCATITAYDAVMGDIASRFDVSFFGRNPPAALHGVLERLCTARVPPVPKPEWVTKNSDAGAELRRAMQALTD